MGCSSGGTSGCGGLTPLPSAPAPVGLPFDQQIEGGLQVRITPPGFTKLSSVIPELLKPVLSTPFCIPTGSLAGTTYCGGACGSGTGCPVTLTFRGDLVPPQGIAVTAPNNANQAVVHIDTAFNVSVPVRTSNFLGTCTFNATTNGTHVNADIGLGTNATTGQLTVGLNALRRDTLNINISSSSGLGCSILASILNGLAQVLDSFIGDFIINALRPTLNSFIQTLLPNPLGLGSTVPLGTLLAAASAPSDANLELYIVPGGYTSASGGGLNLGVITGVNSDRDQRTRTAGLTSEPNLCVPALPTPNLGSAPWNLPRNTVRPDFRLPPAPEFTGQPEPKDSNNQVQDLAIGLSRTFLDLAGFHFFNSGGLCLAVGGPQLAQLNAGTVSLLIPSLGNIVENRRAPLYLSLRPTTPLQFTLGAGTAQDSLLHVLVQDLRIDFYAFVEERYVRIFTVSADLNVGLGLTFTRDQNGNPALQPIISGIDKNSIKLRVSNTDLLQEDPDKLARALSSLIDIAVGQLTGAIPTVSLPSLQGFGLDGLSVTRVQTQQDDFLAINGSIVKQAAGLGLFAADWVPLARPALAIDATAEVADVSVPPGDLIREAVQAGRREAGALPAVTLRLGAQGAEPATLSTLEWSVRVNGGIWQPWSREQLRTLVDPAFLLQGRHSIEVRARVQDDWTTESPAPVRLSVLIDSVPPELTTRVEGDRVVLHAEDNVSDEAALRYAWKTPAGWQEAGKRSELSSADVAAATHGGKDPLVVAAIDEAGNRTEKDVDVTELEPFHDKPGTSTGCACTLGGHGARGQATGGLLALLVMVPLALRLGRRRLRQMRLGRSTGLCALLGAALLGQAGCKRAPLCRVADDCRQTQCGPNEIPACMPDGTCGCNPDTPRGDVGRFSSLVLRDGTAYVAAYNNTYGDLMIGHVTPPGVIDNWEFVDGVPEDVPPDNPQSKVRGGISSPGDDVGRYASIALTPAGDPVIAYYDASHGALKYASFGVVRWQSQVVDQGTGTPTTGGDDFGRYASLTLTRDGRPGIAYYAEVARGASGKRESQLRFAQAKVAAPRTRDDWEITTVETRPLPEVTGTPPPPPDVLPAGIALFCASARKGDDAPVIAYYDRERGNLRYVEYDAATSRFGTPTILDGEAGGTDTGDVGQYPSVAWNVDRAHISYVDARRDNLLYVNTRDRVPEVVDDGYRPSDESTDAGVTVPVYHLVGDSSSLEMWQSRPLIAYQDSTAIELRFAIRDPNARRWLLTTVAGNGSPYQGSYGFYARARVTGSTAVLASYAINQQVQPPRYYVETFAVDLTTFP
ncbi:MAG TPA: hypothetical protein VH877_07585 [Polyangia bacterium]|nr:hypothetical protein [Polyangia bacterium]